jgi:hypothetical protein
MTSSRWLRVSGFVRALAWGACGSEAPASEALAAGSGGTPDLRVDNPGSAGMLAARSGGAGTGGAGSGGAMAAGSGGAGGAAGAAPDDIFGGLFGPAPLSCDGLLCLEDADCSTLYPDETTACKLTRCVDLFCQ